MMPLQCDKASGINKQGGHAGGSGAPTKTRKDERRGAMGCSWGGPGRTWWSLGLDGDPPR